jgi:lipopolysaccharide biosynthesis protein
MQDTESQIYSPPRVVCLYLPQFHPIAENDEWWGKGFTEWRNTAKAKPLYPGHYQPHVPGDLGFYDLRVPEVREQQAAMARQYGIEAFAYYHYWFGNGKRLLERPINDLLQSGQPDFPFCLCWANQSWTGIWHGAPNRTLIEQNYPGPEDDRRHFEAILPALTDARYLKVDGKPVFIVYRPKEHPNVKAFIDYWRELASKAGLPGMYFIGEHRANWNYKECGFDGSITARLPPKRRDYVPWSEPLRKIYWKALDFAQLPTIYRYALLREYLLTDFDPKGNYFPCVIPNWDNTARSGFKGLVFHGSTPELFEEQVRSALPRLVAKPPSERFLFVKSWNEWAEGNHLEPDIRFGHAYLEALRRAVQIDKPNCLGNSHES